MKIINPNTKKPYKYKSKEYKKQSNKRFYKNTLCFFIVYLVIIIVGSAWKINTISASNPINQNPDFVEETESTPVKSTNEIKKEEVDLGVEDQIRQIARQENFQWENYLVRLAHCESRFNPIARNNNGGHSTDRGVFQINDYYHPEVSTECADNIECSTKWTMWRINSGYQHEWVCNNIIL